MLLITVPTVLPYLTALTVPYCAYPHLTIATLP